VRPLRHLIFIRSRSSSFNTALPHALSLRIPHARLKISWSLTFVDRFRPSICHFYCMTIRCPHSSPVPRMVAHTECTSASHISPLLLSSRLTTHGCTYLRLLFTTYMHVRRQNPRTFHLSPYSKDGQFAFTLCWSLPPPYDPSAISVPFWLREGPSAPNVHPHRPSLSRNLLSRE
jgi:hypothetical protein